LLNSLKQKIDEYFLKISTFMNLITFTHFLCYFDDFPLSCDTYVYIPRDLKILRQLKSNHDQWMTKKNDENPKKTFTMNKFFFYFDLTLSAFLQGNIRIHISSDYFSAFLKSSQWLKLFPYPFNHNCAMFIRQALMFLIVNVGETQSSEVQTTLMTMLLRIIFYFKFYNLNIEDKNDRWWYTVMTYLHS
jgi:hypothetical protein